MANHSRQIGLFPDLAERDSVSNAGRSRRRRGGEQIELSEEVGWGGRIRTYDALYQKQVPYHLATPQLVWRYLRNVAGRCKTSFEKK